MHIHVYMLCLHVNIYIYTCMWLMRITIRWFTLQENGVAFVINDNTSVVLLLLSLLTTLQVLYWVVSSRVLQLLDVADTAWEVKKISNQRFTCVATLLQCTCTTGIYVFSRIFLCSFWNPSLRFAPILNTWTCLNVMTYQQQIDSIIHLYMELIVKHF